MKTSKTKFIIIFVICALAFQFITNSLYLSQPRLFPAHGESFLSPEAATGWKNVLALTFLPVKVILIGPLIPYIDLLRQEPDTPPPFFLIGFIFYWTLLALAVRYLIGRIRGVKKA
jgi:hypothetical protein